MSLLLEDNVSSPTLPLDFGAAVTPESLQPISPTANQNGTSGFSWDAAVNSVLKMFDTGVNVYNEVQNKVGAAQVNAAQQQQTVSTQRQIVVPATQQPLILGLNQTQLLWIAGGLGAILVVSLMSHRR